MTVTWKRAKQRQRRLKRFDVHQLPSNDIRRGGITHHLKNDIPIPMVSDRCDVSPDILEKHYDQWSELEKMEQRRNYLDSI